MDSKTMLELRADAAEAIQKVADERYEGEDLTAEQRFAKYLMTEEGMRAKAAFDRLHYGGINKARDDAYARIEAAAEEIRKREPALTKEQAITRVYSERPELVEGYRRETM